MMDKEQASKLFQRMESDCAKLICGSLQDDASRLMEVDALTLSGFSSRLMDIHSEMISLHTDIAASAPQVRGPGRDKDGP